MYWILQKYSFYDGWWISRSISGIEVLIYTNPLQIYWLTLPYGNSMWCICAEAFLLFICCSKIHAQHHGLKACRWLMDGKFNGSSNIITSAIEDLMQDTFVEYVRLFKTIQPSFLNPSTRFMMDWKANNNQSFRVSFEEIHKLVQQVIPSSL